MRSRYTCQQCLASLQRGLRPQRTPSIQQLQAGARRWNSSQSTTARASALARQPATTKRALGTQSQAANSEAHRMPPSPPGLESAATAASQARSVLLKPNNLFHSFSNSPAPEIRRRAAFIKQHAYCPHHSHQQTRIANATEDPEAANAAHGTLPPAHVRYECPDCGIPVSCSEEHFADDYERHLEICDTLREINEDDHDLRSGRFFPEFEYPGVQMEEALVNFTNWDTYLYSREHQAINDDRSLRQATRLLTYPVTIGSVLHELSPYSIKSGGRLTTEGLKSLSALRYTLHPPRSGAGGDIKGLRPNPPPVRIFIVGARAESSLPREVWIQLANMFPRVSFHLIFIGPESMANRDDEFPLPERTPANPFGAVVEDRIAHSLKISTYVEYYHTLHRAGHFYPYDPYFDCFMLFHPGLGHPASAAEWEETLPMLLETKVPILVSGYTEFDMQRDWNWVNEKMGGEVDMLLEPGENRFRSLRWDLNDLDPQDISCGNWGLWAFRGKRYETTTKDSE
ncbi:zinc-finger of mitochondrial splicing suppressor 51-domain-containing protein [Macrophomina phaseolina]|uniref:Zinc-finger of mitochondrial splicing suppressor 51-domain-containing protein n=1 Tax=Macrophomina phaseolina TaxID=35725 RepID=A0ABQ8GK86_9PEZI|nr:zinc-finger of mitochondrial splicing suppressor 51-domain-containing protein [Macrophomina phaseolina]